jgi:hypothetical protein
MRTGRLLAVLALTQAAVLITAGMARAGSAPDELSVRVVGDSSDPREVELELHNAGSKGVSHAGYGPNDVVYVRQCLEDGAWKDDDPGWCGTGMETQSLQPGATKRFTARLCDHQRATKIGVSVSTIDEKAHTTVWSPQIPPRVPTGCLPFEPAVVELRGSLGPHDFSPPTDTLATRSPRRDRRYALVLDRPICLQAEANGGPNPGSKVWHTHVVIEDPARWARFGLQHAVVRGSLSRRNGESPLRIAVEDVRPTAEHVRP